MTDRNPIDPDVYRSLCELLGSMNHLYHCMQDAADGLHKAATALAGASGVFSQMTTTTSTALDHIRPADNAHPTEE